MKTLIIIAAFFALTVSSFAQNGATQHKDVEVFGAFYNECCDEVVILSGTAHVVLRGEGQSFNNSHLNMKGATGTGENGRSYTQKGSTTQNIEVKEDGSWTATFQIKMKSDDGCDFTIHQLQKGNFNANGELVVEILNYTITCN
jgi:hypothetical protein